MPKYGVLGWGIELHLVYSSAEELPNKARGLSRLWCITIRFELYRDHGIVGGVNPT